MTHDVCRDCGETKKLNASGVCEWRAGCEHRVAQRQARAARAEHAVAVSVEEAFFEAALELDEMELYHELGWCHTEPTPLRPDLER